ncbi:type I-D CRISPR-associated endonuclease Cas1d [Halovenus sp. HT40]|uniref:type I-D CRISPR-associated endonuclease Cas1d n=1 Tax=Halovenus sp. HT40 TaxID=3126691 RepID=UPI00300F3C12
MKSPEGMFDESVIYVTTQGSQVRTDGGRIVIWDVDGDDGELGSYPKEKLDTINVFGGVNFSTPFVAEANEHGIVLNYFTQNGKYRGSFVPEKNTIAEVRRAQYALNPARELEIAREMIAGKIRNQRTLLSRKGVTGTDVLKDLGVRVEKTKTKDELRGAEGEAAERYFDRLDETLVDGWTFEKRTKRPPEDHINSLLSLTYVFMKNEVMSALRQYNLDPFLGVLHADRHGRPSLALDLQEEFRPIFCDALVTRLVNRGTIVHDDFNNDNRLGDDAFKTYLSKFDEFMQEEFEHPHFEYTVTRRKAIRQQAILLRKAITGEMDNYHALTFKR